MAPQFGTLRQIFIQAFQDKNLLKKLGTGVDKARVSWGIGGCDITRRKNILFFVSNK